MQETLFLNENDMIVTNTRFSIFGQTFALAKVSSVRSIRKNPSRLLPIILGAAALLAFVDGGTAVVVLGILLLVAAGSLWFLQKPEFILLLSTPVGEAKVLISRDNEQVAKVLAALHQALLHRG
jgi:hypothetical protein